MRFLETKERQFERDFDSINDVKFKEVLVQAQTFLDEIHATPTLSKHMSSEKPTYAQN